MHKIYQLLDQNDFTQNLSTEDSESIFYNALKMYKADNISAFNSYYQHNTLVYREHLKMLNNQQLVVDLTNLTNKLDEKMIKHLEAGNRTNDMRFNQLFDYVDLKSDINVLDFGCGTGLYIDQLLERNVTNIDCSEINQTAIEYCQTKYQGRNVRIINSDVEPLGTNYDLVIMSNVLHHLGTKKQYIINDLYERMNTGAQFALTELDPTKATEHHQNHTISHLEIIELFKNFTLKVSKSLGSDLILYVFIKN